MTNPVVDRLARTPFPRLTLLVVAGFAAFAAAGVLAVVDPVLAGTYSVLRFRLFVAGYLLALFGGAGYVALFVAERIPDA